MTRLLESQVLPRLSGILRFVDTVSPGVAPGVEILTGSTQGWSIPPPRRPAIEALFLEDRLPGGAVVDRLPEPAGGGGSVDDSRVILDDAIWAMRPLVIPGPMFRHSRLPRREA